MRRGGLSQNHETKTGNKWEDEIVRKMGINNTCTFIKFPT